MAESDRPGAPESIAELRCLVAEDEPEHADGVRRMLVRAFGVGHCVTVVDRLDAALAGQARHDVVLLDLNLVDADGEATLAALAAGRFEVPVVVVTSSGDDELGRRAVRCGAQDFLRKSELQPTLLARSLRYAVERHGLLADSARQAEALRMRTRDLETLLEITRTELAAALDRIAESCRELEDRARMASRPQSSAWLFDARRSALAARHMIATIGAHFHGTSRLPGDGVRSLHAALADTAVWPEGIRVDVESLPESLAAYRSRMPESALIRVVATLLDAIPARSPTLDIVVENRLARMRVIGALPERSVAVQDLGLDLLRDLLSVDLALGWQLVRNTVENFGGTAKIELHGADAIGFVLTVPLVPLVGIAAGDADAGTDDLEGNMDPTAGRLRLLRDPDGRGASRSASDALEGR
ncbi:MAG: response regulator [Planctomycetes bacterium]|nr:response regulator [Planctomycetota bacterium]